MKVALVVVVVDVSSWCLTGRLETEGVHHCAQTGFAEFHLFCFLLKFLHLTHHSHKVNSFRLVMSGKRPLDFSEEPPKKVLILIC